MFEWQLIHMSHAVVSRGKAIPETTMLNKLVVSPKISRLFLTEVIGRFLQLLIDCRFTKDWLLGS